MQIAKWGNSLAVRLPAALVRKLGLKPGDEVELVAGTADSGNLGFEVLRKPTRDESLNRLKALRWPLPEGYAFDRGTANERDDC